MPPVKTEPGRDPQMVERAAKLNLLFAVSSLGLLVAFSLMVWADYNREWKRYQVEFNHREVGLTEGQIKQALGKVDAGRRAKVAEQLARGEQEIAARRADVRKAQAEVDRIHAEWYGIDQDSRFTKADIGVKTYDYDEAVHAKSPAAAGIKAALDAQVKRLAVLRGRLEDVLAREQAAKDRVAELEKTRLGAEKAQKDLYAERDRLEDKLRKIQEGWVYRLRNLPILDMANPSIKIQQIMPANLYENVNFAVTPKVDRCTTCHLGIDTPGYEKAPQPFTRHPDPDLYLRGPHAMEKMGCTVCHQGRGRATGFQTAAHVPSTKEQEKAWGKYTGTAVYREFEFWDHPMMTRDHVESQCRKCHRGVVDVPKAPKLDAGLELIERYGCFGCHKIAGWESLRKVGPDLTRITSKTSRDWIVRWISEPRAFRPTRMPQIWGVRNQETPALAARDAAEINAVATYVAEKSQTVSYPDPPKGDITRGRRLFETVGCLGCHRVGDDRRAVEGLEALSFRTHGPNLDGTGSKVKPGWLYAWVQNPKGYWHETKMPRLRLSPSEAADITAYLMTLKNDAFTKRPGPKADPAVRDQIIREYLLAQNTIKDADAKLAAMSDHERTLYLGEKTIGHYGCFGCHNIPGFEKANPIGVELTEEGSKLIERLDFGFQEEKIPHTLPAWFKKKLLEPRIFDVDKQKAPGDLLRMPQFHLSDEEADDIVTALLSFTKDEVPLVARKQLSPDEVAVQAGWRLVRNLNCQGCHPIGEKGGAIRTVIEDELKRSGGDPLQAVALSPPVLFAPKSGIGEGSRVQTPWLHNFLLDPSHKIRPWLGVRMPTFDFTEQQLNTLTRYFAAMDKVPYPFEPEPPADPQQLAVGHDLFQKWQCVRCHVVAGKLPNQEPANMAPDLANVRGRLRSVWIAEWLANPQSIQPGTRMPSNFPKNPDENAYPEILGGDQQKQIQAVRAYLLSLGAEARRGGS